MYTRTIAVEKKDDKIRVEYCNCGEVERKLRKGERCFKCEQWERERQEATRKWDANKHE